MRHSKVINHLGRTSSHRKSMLSNMAASLILHKRISTTTAKAKALKTFVEPLITKSKEDSTHSRRVVFSYLKDKTAVAELFREISPKVGERPGGYTRILKTGHRIGDNADMCILELVDYNEAMMGGGEAAKTKTTRRRKTSKKKDDTAAEVKAPKAAKEKAPKTSEPVAKAEKAEDKPVTEE
jgi:large subunit ribosomal protein L17